MVCWIWVYVLVLKLCFVAKTIKHWKLYNVNLPVESTSKLYPYGTETSDTFITNVDDEASAGIHMTRPFDYFGTSYSTFYVSVFFKIYDPFLLIISETYAIAILERQKLVS